jgi:hypothetical protein
MAVLTWDGTGQRKYETGVDHGVLYPLDPDTALYTPGVAWNGLTAVNEKPAGAAANPQFADNLKYLNLRSAETFAGTIQAFTYPDEFGPCDGTDAPVPGLQIGQQGRQTFGLCYRTKVGTDVSEDAGFKLHLVYGATAAPSEKDYATVNDSPAAVGFSWDFDCTPVAVSNLNPTCLITVDSTEVDSGALSDLMDQLYGTLGSDPVLPDPDTVIGFFSGSVTAVTLTAPTFDGAHTITIPTETGVTYYVDGVEHAGGSQLLTTGQKMIVTARANVGYVFNKPFVNEWMFTFVS